MIRVFFTSGPDLDPLFAQTYLFICLGALLYTFMGVEPLRLLPILSTPILSTPNSSSLISSTFVFFAKTSF